MTDQEQQKKALATPARDDAQRLLDELESLGAEPAPRRALSGAQARPKASSSSSKESSSNPPAGGAAIATQASGVGSGGGTKMDEAQALLDSFDELAASTARKSLGDAGIARPPSDGPGSVRADLSRASSRGSLKGPTVAAASGSGRVSSDSQRSPGGAGQSKTPPFGDSAASQSVPTKKEATAQGESDGDGGWGSWGGGSSWGAMWSQASNVLQQARNAADEQVRNLQKNEQARKWGENVRDYVKNVQLEKIGHDLSTVGRSTLSDILNAVAPPIAEHEVIEITLSHDMVGYDGIESLVYKVLAKVMEQVENGGDLVVNKREEEKRKEEAGAERDLNAIDGFQAAYKLAEANLESLIKRYEATPKPTARSPNVLVPVTTCPVFLRIQPCLAALPFYPLGEGEEQGESKDALGSSPEAQRHLFFVLLLQDPNNALSHRTVTQALPGSWLDVPWEQNEWVEDAMVDVLKGGLTVIAQDYVSGRQTGRSIKAIKPEAVQGEKSTTEGVPPRSGGEADADAA